MKNVIYIAGIGATGKSSVASLLSKKLGIPMISTDEIYRSLHEELGNKYPNSKNNHWGEIMLVENQKIYPDFFKFKERFYIQYLGKLKSDFIIEGFTLMYKEDRQLIEKIIGKHWTTFFLIESSFEEWLKISSNKYGKDSVLTYDTYKNYIDRFEAPDHFYTIKDFKYPLTVGRVDYQKLNFTDKKWDALKITNLNEKTVLDCGCNDGWIGKYCLDVGAKYVLGLDNNWLYLEEARKRGLDTKLFNLEEMADFKEQFDVVLCLATLHHLENRETFLKNVSGITKEMFVLEVPIWDNGEIALKYIKEQEVFVPTEKYILYWLGKYFRRVEIVGKSVPPGDNSHRLIFKAYR